MTGHSQCLIGLITSIDHEINECYNDVSANGNAYSRNTLINVQ